MVTTPDNDEGLITFLTRGTWDVTEMLAYDSEEKYLWVFMLFENIFTPLITQHKKASNQHANLPLEMYSFTL